jgi:hypothetical protein
MTLFNGQALAGAQIPSLVPLRETAKLPPNASTLRAIRQASITGTCVTAKSGDKAAPWFRLTSGGAASRRCAHAVPVTATVRASKAMHSPHVQYRPPCEPLPLLLFNQPGLLL